MLKILKKDDSYIGINTDAIVKVTPMDTFVSEIEFNNNTKMIVDVEFDKLLEYLYDISKADILKMKNDVSDKKELMSLDDGTPLKNICEFLELPNSISSKLGRRGIKTLKDFREGENIWKRIEFLGNELEGVNELANRFCEKEYDDMKDIPVRFLIDKVRPEVYSLILSTHAKTLGELTEWSCNRDGLNRCLWSPEDISELRHVLFEYKIDWDLKKEESI